MSGPNRIFVSFFVATVAMFPPFGFAATPDDVMRAAGYDVDNATSTTPKWEIMVVYDRPCYRITYYFGRDVVFLKVDPATSETLGVFARVGRGPNPTSPTANLTAEWAKQMLMQMNTFKVVRKEAFLADPVISYEPNSAEYLVSFPRTDTEGHVFLASRVGFHFDHGTSLVTSFAAASLDLPEPSVTTGTMVSEQQARSLALEGLNARKSVIFRRVPEKMQFSPATEPIRVRVVQRDNMFSPELTEIEDMEYTTGTAVVYIIHFDSEMADPSYQGDYDYVKVKVHVDVFSGELVGGEYAKEVILRDD